MAMESASPAVNVAWARMPPVSMPGSTQVHGRAGQAGSTLAQRPVATVHAAVARGDAGMDVDHRHVDRIEERAGDDARPVHHDDDGFGPCQEGGRVLVVDRAHVDGLLHGGQVELAVPRDLLRTSAPAPAQERHDEADEGNLAGHRPPAELPGAPAGERQSRGRVLQDHGHPCPMSEVCREA